MRRVVVALVLVTGCAGNLNFRIDHRLHWQGTRDRALVTLPMRLQWTFSGKAPARFGVFVDRAPIRPGQSLRAVAGSDRSCRQDPACPNPEYLAQRKVYTTASMSISLDTVLPLSGNRDDTQLHRATVVLLDPSGRRIGESAWSRDFKLKRVAL